MAEEESTAEEDPLIGSLIDGRYRVLRRIGEGGMGAVYEVEHVRIARRFALKSLHAELARNRDLVARFHREAMAAGAIGDEHIVQVSDMGQLDGGEPFLVMELLEGQDLAAEIQHRHPLPVARLVRIALQACEALGAAHAKGIVHRDLKPENIFLARHPKQPDFVKVLDFGISKFKEGSIALDAPSTRTGMALGTPYYMAPEQIEGVRDIDGRTDVYALACVLFEAVTGRVPFDAPTFPALVVKITHEPPPAITELRPDVPVELEEIIRRGLSKAREERFEDMEAFARALTPLAQESSVTDVATAPTMAGGGVTPAGREHTPPGKDGGFAPSGPERTSPDEAASEPERATPGERGGIAPSRPKRTTPGERGKMPAATRIKALVAGAVLAGLTLMTATLYLTAAYVLGPDGSSEQSADEDSTETTDGPDEPEATTAAAVPDAQTARAESVHVEGTPNTGDDTAASDARDAGGREGPGRNTNERPRAETGAKARGQVAGHDADDGRSVSDGPAAPDPPRRQLKPGVVSVYARGGWAKVSVGGRQVGTTPRRVTLPAGRHVLVLRPPDGPPIRRVVRVRPGKQQTVTVDLGSKR